MSIAEFIRRTKAQATSMVEARKLAVAEQRKARYVELSEKNKVLRAEAKERKAYDGVKSENKRLKQEAFKSRFGFLTGGSVGSKSKVKSGFSSPFNASSGFGGNSPFRPDNLQKDSFGKSQGLMSSKGSDSFGGGFFSPEKKKSVARKKRSGKTIVVKV